MLSYTPNLTSAPPYDPQQRAAALAAITAPSPYRALGRNHQDAMDALAGRAAAKFDMDASRANTEYDLDRQQAERSLTVQGLQNAAQTQQNRRSITNNRLQNLYGFADGLLRDLLR